ncbi:MAG: PQQ-binding-like beta-propeller repeat protein [Saprospiraceae bacterium]|nr:PQQ-binding-like beta-propeller repeat protein [Saprospiraceae bacterium]MBK9681088.1 PQQ-binding-like beta-propeller repeat protein [Saprospiraceae bacterium]
MIKKTVVYSFPLYAVLTIFLTQACRSHPTKIVWDQSFAGIGSQSSPRPIDINHDGVDDLVMGACKNEYQPTDMGVLALDGKTGKVLWQVASDDQVYGSATLEDINGDQSQDVIIGGRWAFLKAIDGSNGKVIWSYTRPDSTDPVLKYAHYNFYNSVLVPDQNNDGVKDILIQNGGNHAASPNDSIHRYPGVLMVFDGKSGQVLAADLMPDGRESYMAPLYFEQPDKSQWIVFGSGGETFGGHLFLARLEDLMHRQLKNAVIIATEPTSQGFIGPPVLADINHDQYLDIISISHGSSVFAIDGRTSKMIWSTTIPASESSNSFAVGQFTGDETPDFFTFVSRGVWPHSTGSVQVLLDGKDGRIAFTDSIGCAGFSSPVAYDLNHDGTDEVIISINEYDCNRGYTATSRLDIENKLLAINFKNHEIQNIEQLKGFKNIFSTPYLGDLDHDGYLDIVYSQFYSPTDDLLIFLGMRTKRVSTSIKMKKPVKWGGYMGSNANGQY